MWPIGVATVKERVRQQALIVLADYASCDDGDGFHRGENCGLDQSEEIARRIVDNFMLLTRRKARPAKKEQRIAAVLLSEARARRDKWAACRKPGIRGLFADETLLILYGRG